MNYEFSPEQLEIRAAIERICQRFGDDYWLKKDREGGFPAELHQALAADGWLGIAMPEEYGGAGLGITEAALMMQTISESGAGMQGASAVHMNIFGLHPVVKHGTELEIVATNPLGETIDGSLAIVGDKIFARGESHLFCIGSK